MALTQCLEVPLFGDLANGVNLRSARYDYIGQLLDFGVQPEQEARLKEERDQLEKWQKKYQFSFEQVIREGQSGVSHFHFFNGGCT
jgi:hypothetical protein